MRVIFTDIEPDDFVLAIRAVKWLLDEPDKMDAIVTYGEVGGGSQPRDFFVRRNKASITVRRASYDQPDVTVTK